MSDAGHDRPTVGMVCYGSLLSPDEISPFLDGNDAFSRATPVRVEGFRRSFSQRSVWRAKAEGEAAGVLNAVRDGDAWMNAIVVPDLSAGEYGALRDRERGYRMVEAEPTEIGPYGEAEPPGSDIYLVATGREERAEEGLTPVPEYVEICLEGARSWGEGFYEDFLDTTDVGGGGLREYVGERG